VAAQKPWGEGLHDAVADYPDRHETRTWLESKRRPSQSL
jgi:hypothetical protein